MRKWMLGWALCLWVPMAWAAEERTVIAPPQDLMDDVPADFPRFAFAGHEEEAQWLSRYLWYHFSKRGGVGKTVFNQEYVTTADLWLAGGVRPGLGKPKQAHHREGQRANRQEKDG